MVLRKKLAIFDWEWGRNSAPRDGQKIPCFPIGILGQVWYLIESMPDLCTLTYFEWENIFVCSLVYWEETYWMGTVICAYV